MVAYLSQNRIPHTCLRYYGEVYGNSFPHA
jgi:hypothetical protein